MVARLLAQRRHASHPAARLLAARVGRAARGGVRAPGTSSPSTCRSSRRIGINLYQTATLLVIAYIASSLPTNARVLVGPVSQLQPSLRDAARAHGAGALHGLGEGRAAAGRPDRCRWPGCSPSAASSLSCPSRSCCTRRASHRPRWPSSDNLSNYHFGVGMAQSVLAVAIALARRRARARRLPAAGAGRLAPDRSSDPWLNSITIERRRQDVPRRQPGARGRHASSVEPGTFVVLLGPSGSGKTTLLRCLAGIERVSSGRIAIGGTSWPTAQRHVPPDRRDLSMVFQDYALWPHLRVRENVAFALRRRKLDQAGRPGAGAGHARARRTRRARRRATRPSCPAASSSASRWPGHWLAIPG